VPQRKKCIFCGDDAAKITGEHVWSAWIGRLFTSSAYTWTLVDPETGKKTVRDCKTVDFTVNDVCKPCNEGWLSRLEARAKFAFSDMIRDRVELSLLPDGAVLLAAFAFKSAVIATCMNKSREPFFTPAARLRFKDSLEIPPGTQIWLARFSGGAASSGLFSGHVLEPNAPKGTPLHNLEMYAFTYVAGRLVLQVLTHRWADIMKRGSPFPRLRPSRVWDSVSTQVWPNEGLPIGWPPEKYLGDDSLDTFVNRWENRINV
jgi:hypothetical protein